MRRRVLLLLAFLFLVVRPAGAQIVAGVAYTAFATHDGLNTVSYVLRLDASDLSRVSVSALVGGEVAFPGIVFSAGQHVIEICAENPATLPPIACSGPLQFTTDAMPVGPRPPGSPGLRPTPKSTTAPIQGVRSAVPRE